MLWPHLASSLAGFAADVRLTGHSGQWGLCSSGLQLFGLSEVASFWGVPGGLDAGLISRKHLLSTYSMENTRPETYILHVFHPHGNISPYFTGVESEAQEG